MISVEEKGVLQRAVWCSGSNWLISLNTVGKAGLKVAKIWIVAIDSHRRIANRTLGMLGMYISDIPPFEWVYSV